CGLVSMGSCLVPGAVGAAASSFQNSAPVTPCEEKERFSQKWVKRFFDVFDKDLDDGKKKEIMKSCGKMCFQGSLGDKKVNPVDIDALIEGINKGTGEIAAKRDGNVVDFHYVSNPRGLRVADGYCLCPLVESGPEGLSGTYCECSVGYVKEMFQTYTGGTVNVELLESLKRGGKSCRFRITFTS
ncbi:MAG TPA: DUF6144 family protein, partial [Candidatus Acidoferrales bacterium]|nr:DUF6144 family protein [Candidatus Acidoferrales bacterium]